MPKLTRHYSSAPTRKVAYAAGAGGIAPPLVGLLDWIMNDFFHRDIPATVEGYMVALIMLGVAYYTHEKG